MANRCPYPNCNLPEEHEGDHHCLRPPVPRAPIAELKPPMIPPGYPRGIELCDIGNGGCRVKKPYVDAAGYIWELCDQHAEAYGHH